jgi:hypothetical protein
MPPEQRRAPRYPLIAAAEIVELATATCIMARTSDLSLVGCYLDMVNPLPVGVEIRLRLAHHGKTFSTLGIVAWSKSNMGMEVTFIEVEQDQQRVLQKWLVDLSVTGS